MQLTCVVKPRWYQKPWVFGVTRHCSLHSEQWAEFFKLNLNHCPGVPARRLSHLLSDSLPNHNIVPTTISEMPLTRESVLRGCQKPYSRPTQTLKIKIKLRKKKTTTKKSLDKENTVASDPLASISSIGRLIERCSNVTLQAECFNERRSRFRDIHYDQ